MNGTKRMMRLGNMLTGGQVEATVVDVGECLSRENRRLYRQGMRYTCKLDFESLPLVEPAGGWPEDSNGDPVLPRYRVYTLNDTWSTQAAWRKALESHMNNSVEEEGRRARWNDFRVAHGWTAGGTSQAFPMVFTGADLNPRPLSAGEFVLSESHTEEGDTYTYSWGPSSTSPNIFNIVEEFDKSAKVHVEPSQVVGEMPYSRLNEAVSAEQSEHLQDAGNNPPYNQLNSNPFEWTCVADINITGDGTTQSTGFFDAPCGFVVVVGYYKPYTEFNPLQDSLMKLTVQKGNYKGVKATPLGIAKKVGALEYKVV